MEASAVSRAVSAAMSIAAAAGLAVEDASVMHNSNTLTLRLRPADVLARVSPVAQQNAQFQIDLAERLVLAGCPVAALEPRVEPRVYERDAFAITFWTYYESGTPDEVSAVEYATALQRLHAGMRGIDFPAPHFTDRVASALELLAGRDRTPALGEADREVLVSTLRATSRGISERGGPGQLIHGEPHPGNLLATRGGPVFIDLETCCRGPVEFDLAHAPEDVSEHYRGLDHQLLWACRRLVLAMITTWRWDRDDQLPGGRQLGEQWLDQLRATYRCPSP